MCSERRSTCCGSESARNWVLRFVRGLVAVALVVFVSACQPLPGSPAGPARDAGLSPVLKRMRDTYEDLAGGRFVSLADFETPGQETLFRCVGPEGAEGDRPQPTLSILRSRNETGAGGLKSTLRGPDDRLVFDGKRSPNLALVRDWQPYALLLMSVYGPPEGVLLEFSIASGDPATLVWTRTMTAGPGWNLLRVDLGTVGEWINLADVRALTWRAPQTAGPIELYVDDVILADNTHHVLGEKAGTGEMYVLTRGRRIIVGARDRFELAFADGQIVAWHAGGDANLVDPDGLGPWPVPLPEDWQNADPSALAYDDPAHYADWGAVAAATQKLIEATPFRAVIEGRWRFIAPGDKLAEPPAPGEVGHRWQYVIYPTGAVGVQVTSQAPAAGWKTTRVGYAVALNGRQAFRRVDPPPAEAGPEAASFMLLSQPGAERADLCWILLRAADFRFQRVLASADDRRLAAIVGDVPAAPRVVVVHQFRLWPWDIDGAPEATSLAADVWDPATVELTAGRRVIDTPGDLDGDGYNEAEGCYELAPQGPAVRFRLHPGPHVRFETVCRIHGTEGRPCWVYARGRLVEDVGRDAGDRLLLRLPRGMQSPLAVEVHIGAAGAKAP